MQFLAGQMWSWAHMRSEIGGVRAIDPTKERVDGGRIAEPLTDVVKRALDDLRGGRLALGEDGTALVADVIGKGLTLAKAADARGLSSKSGREYLGRRFRECLDRLAVVFGCATEGRNGGQRASQIAPLSPTEPQVFRSAKQGKVAPGAITRKGKAAPVGSAAFCLWADGIKPDRATS